MSEPAVVTGMVTNTQGAPEAAVMIRIDALNVGTTTAPDGSYRLVIPADHIGSGKEVRITASRVGLATQSREREVAPGGNYTQNFELAPNAIILEG